jgi:hypothetical protein
MLMTWVLVRVGSVQTWHQAVGDMSYNASENSLVFLSYSQGPSGTSVRRILMTTIDEAFTSGDCRFVQSRE